MYDDFGFDLSQASFEWDEKKEQFILQSTVSISGQQQKSFLIPTCLSGKMKSIRRNCGMMYLAG